MTDNRTFEIHAEELDDLRRIASPRNTRGNLVAEVVVSAPAGSVKIELGTRSGLGRFFAKIAARHADKRITEELFELGSDLTTRRAAASVIRIGALSFCALILTLQFANLMLTEKGDVDSPETARLQVYFMVNTVLTWLLARGALSRITMPAILRPPISRWDPSTITVNRATVVGVVIAILALLVSVAALIPAYVALLQN
ncbi:hypothetical protein ACIRON_28925 [Nocardioides sp. NPDC101246]|uniref:hypothetical protein n=1 Tax=Nocardioides sp. NPDC101246 TaxID=3364336 RepID=UPI0037F7EA5A